MTELHEAVDAGDIDRVEGLVKELAPGLEGIEAVDDAGWTALHIAAINNCVDIAELLLENGADVNARGTYEPVHMDIAGAAGVQELAQDVLAQAAGQDAPSSVGGDAGAFGSFVRAH